MIEHIITKMVLDRTCPVCGGLKRYKPTGKVREETIECNNCNGKGFMADTEPSILIVPFKRMLHSSIIATMKRQRMHVVENEYDEEVRGIKPMRVYCYNIPVDSAVFRYYSSREPKEIHLFFD